VVRVRHDEDVASHIGPKRRAGIRKGGGEASVWANVQASHRAAKEKPSWVPTLLPMRKARRQRASSRTRRGPRVIVEPGMYCSRSRFRPV
jgi:hypothetical protein